MAWRLAEKGHRCMVVERDALDSLGAQIGPFHMEESAFERYGIPPPEGDELLHRIEAMTLVSPGGRRLSFELPTLCMDKPSFHRRLHGYAREAGVELVRGEVVGPVLEDGLVRGLEIRLADCESALRARLVVDASGIEGAVRPRMPPGPWRENDPVTPGDTIFVYMETWADVEGALGPGVESYPRYIGWCAPGPGDTWIVGVGTGGSMDAARVRHRVLVDSLPFGGRVAGSTGGRIPYRRPPYSLVDDGLAVVGDAACMNKPFSGEGVTSGLAGCAILIEVADRALASGEIDRKALWAYNARYFRGQGAKFAYLTASMPALMGISPAELDFLFEVPGIMSEEAARRMQEEYEVSTSPGDALRALPHLAGGLLKGRLRPSTVARIAGSGMTAGSLRRLYERYPESPAGFHAWATRCDRYWMKANALKHGLFASM